MDNCDPLSSNTYIVLKDLKEETLKVKKAVFRPPFAWRTMTAVVWIHITTAKTTGTR